jgi:hypothetical protein
MTFQSDTGGLVLQCAASGKELTENEGTLGRSVNPEGALGQT